MKEYIELILNAPIPTVLVFAGLGLILLSFIGRMTANISIPSDKKPHALFAGTVLLVAGIALPIFTQDFGDKKNVQKTPVSTVSRPESRVWLLQFGAFGSEASAKAQKTTLESKGFENLAIAKFGDYPTIRKNFSYLVYGPAKQSEIAEYLDKNKEAISKGNIQFWIRDGYKPSSK